MAAISLKAHYDGRTIQLDEPYELLPNARLIVTVLPPESSEDERAAWAVLAVEGLARAYGDNEPDYSTSDIVP
jgi:hypothetical protein